MAAGYGNEHRAETKISVSDFSHQAAAGSGKKEMAIPHVFMLLDVLEKYQLKEWEPDLAVQGLILVFEALEGVEDYEQKRDEIKQMLICLNPSLALKVL